jgi:hypothetical protein
MEKLLEIISQLRHVTEWSQPNMKFDETMALINELEKEVNALQASEPKEEIVEVPQEPITIEEVVTEEPVVTEEAPKKRNYHFKKKEKPVE